jgi:hypothetical protein
MPEERPHGTCPPQPELALVWLYDRIAEATAARDWRAVESYLEAVTGVVERTRLPE